MIKFVNDELFSFTPTTERPEGKEPFFKLRILTSNKIIKTPRDGEAKDANYFEPLIREVMTVTAPDENYNQYVSNLRVQDDERGNTKVRVQCFRESTNRNANLFLLAIPFNGRIQPIPRTKDYRIYKGVLVTSARTFWFRGNRFRKILYLVIEPNILLFNDQPEMNIDVTAFGFFRDQQDEGKQKTAKDIHTFTLKYDHNAPKEEQITAEYSFNRELLDDAVIPQQDRNQPTWVQFRFQNRNNMNTPSGYNRPNYQAHSDSPRQPYPKQDRGQSAPRYFQKPQGQPYNDKPVDRDLDKMIESSGMRETAKRFYHDDSGRAGKHVGNRGKKSKKKNRQ